MHLCSSQENWREFEYHKMLLEWYSYARINPVQKIISLSNLSKFI